MKLSRQKAYDEEGDNSDEFIDIRPLDDYEEELKEGKGLKVLTPNKLLTRLPILLAQIKAGNNSFKFEKWNKTNTVSLVSP